MPSAWSQLADLIPQLEQSLLLRKCPPSCLLLWTQAITRTFCDPMADELAILRARAASLWSQLDGSRTPNHSFTDAASSLEKDLDAWAEAAMREQKAVALPLSHLTPAEFGAGTKAPSYSRMWIDWHICRVIAAWLPKRFDPDGLSSPDADMINLSSIRRHMVSLVHTMGLEFAPVGDMPREGLFENVISTSYWVVPLYFAGLCVLAEHRDTVMTNGSRQGYMCAQVNYLRYEMRWILNRLTRIAMTLGDQHANEVVKILSATRI